MFGKSTLSKDASICLGKEFLLQELAFIINTPNTLGLSNIGYVYYKTMDILKEIIEGKYPNLKKEGIGYLIIN